MASVQDSPASSDGKRKKGVGSNDLRDNETQCACATNFMSAEAPFIGILTAYTTDQKLCGLVT